eukprot:gene6673-6743_t
MYRYFPSKNALIEEIYQTVFLESWDPSWDAILTDPTIPMAERLCRFYSSYTDAIMHPEWMRIYLFAGLKGVAITGLYIARVEERIIIPIIREMCIEKGRALPEPIDPRLLELAWSLQGGIFYYGVRKFVYQTPVHEAKNAMIASAVDVYVRQGVGKTVTTIICTRNRVASLSRTLQAMSELELSGVDFELVVVDNGSTDGTAEAVARFGGEAAFAVRYVFIAEPGLSRARNAGLAAAQGGLIVFTDDDCLVAADWITALIRSFAGDPLQVIGGRVELFDLNNLEMSYKAAPDPAVCSSLHLVNNIIIGANFAFGREVVDRIGLFDVRFGAGTPLHAAEEGDFVFRAMQAGVPVRYDPSILLHHDHGRPKSDRAAMERGYTIGNGGLAAKTLLAGHTELLQSAYWAWRSAFRNRTGMLGGWQPHPPVGAFLRGFCRYVFVVLRLEEAVRQRREFFVGLWFLGFTVAVLLIARGN